MMVNLRHISLKAHPCYRDQDPINLYHKVGHGTLDMYVLNPSKDSREVREFLAKWNASDSKLFAGNHRKDGSNLIFPIQNIVSICALLVWQPANPEDTITRILFPGSTPQHKIFEGFERLKHLEFLKHSICTAKSLSPSTSLATLKDKTKHKFSIIDRERKLFEAKKEKRDIPETKKSEESPQRTPISVRSVAPRIDTNIKRAASEKTAENKKIESEKEAQKKETKEIKKVKREVKKVEPKEKPEKQEVDAKKPEVIKTDVEKIVSKPKQEPKKREQRDIKIIAKAASAISAVKSEVNQKVTGKIAEKRAKSSDKRDVVKSSPTTPKKTLNGAVSKVEVTKAAPKPKPVAKSSAVPAKSAKDANNRKVAERESIGMSVQKESATKAAAAKPKPAEKKPVARKPKPMSPSKARLPGSPIKSTRSTPTSVKSDKDGVIRRGKGDKGTTDSSTVSTPSGVEPESAIKLADKSLTEKSEDMSLDSIESKVLADLKEEREVVEEIEAVLQKAERIQEGKKDDQLEGDDEITAEAMDKTEEDVTADIEEVPKPEVSRKASHELTEEEEYLIVEKEEIYTEDSMQSGEGEQKHILDEAQSEKSKLVKDEESAKKGIKEEEKALAETEQEEKEKDDVQEKNLALESHVTEATEISTDKKDQLEEQVQEIIASATEMIQKTEERDDSGKKDSEELTKEGSSLSPDKLDSSEKKTSDTDKLEQGEVKDQIPEKLTESQERVSTLESNATTTAPTLPEDERIPLDEIKEDIDEKYALEEVKEEDTKEPQAAAVPLNVGKPEIKTFDVLQTVPTVHRDIVKTPDEVADLPVHEEVDPKLYSMEAFDKEKDEKVSKESPSSKDQKKGFFGKVADKFEKGIDKLTGKSKKDEEKEGDEKSPKSPSVKEGRKDSEFLEDVDMESVFRKVCTLIARLTRDLAYLTFLSFRKSIPLYLNLCRFHYT